MGLFNAHLEAVYEAEADKIYEKESVMSEKRIVYKVPVEVKSKV